MRNIVVIGAGKWAHECWAPLLRDHQHHYTVRAVVDPELPRALSLATSLGIDHITVHATLADALDRHDDLAAGIVLTSPEHHAEVIVQLARGGLDVLTEKPLATSTADLDALTASVTRCGIKLGVIQNYRYQNRIRAARHILTSGELGELHYLVARFAADYRQPGSWDVGDAHTMDDPLLIEASVHHLDMIRYLSGADITHVTAATTNPAGSSFHGDSLGGLLLRLDNGAFALYEASLLAAGSENRWRAEHYRAECRHGSLTCDGPTLTITRGRNAQVLHTPDTDMFDGHRAQLASFSNWLAGDGQPVETTLDDNSRSISAVFAALTSTRTGTTARVATPHPSPGPTGDAPR
jgi:predicted dehydrogenase